MYFLRIFLLYMTSWNRPILSRFQHNILHKLHLVIVLWDRPSITSSQFRNECKQRWLNSRKSYRTDDIWRHTVLAPFGPGTCYVIHTSYCLRPGTCSKVMSSKIPDKYVEKNSSITTGKTMFYVSLGFEKNSWII